VAHLHSQRIVHRDIKPHNILCALPDENINSNESDNSITHHNELGEYILKISDMGLSKQLNNEEGSFGSISMSLPQQVKDHSCNSSSGGNTVDNGPVGTIGWQAPELMALRGSSNLTNNELEDNNIKENNKINNDDEDDEGEITRNESIKSIDSYEDELLIKDSKYQSRRRTQNVDIFSLGCVFHYVLVPGEHPFGLWYEREANIMTGKANLSRLSLHNDAKHLINLMIQTNPIDRPSANQVCNHPFFWSSSKRLEFLIDLSDKIDQEAIDSPIIQALEKNSQLIVGSGWDKCLYVPLIEDLNKYRKYDISSIRDLLRVIRNKKHHYNELSQQVKDTIGDLPTGFIQYFEINFPNLFMHAVEVSCQYLSTDTDLLIYYKSICALFKSKDNNIIFKDKINLSEIKSDELLSKALSNSFNNSPKNSSNSNSSKSNISSSKINDSDGDLILHGGSQSLNTGRGWWQSGDIWENTKTFNKALKTKSSRLIRSSNDFKYRSRLCTHWDLSMGKIIIIYLLYI
jgi:serine/threonine-protein kinase/endoribonuclease IRE1